jgi:hypothetical protein
MRYRICYRYSDFTSFPLFIRLNRHVAPTFRGY